MLTERLVRELESVVGGPQVIRDPDLAAGYLRDWTGRFQDATTGVVIRPGSSSEVAAVLGLCRAGGVAVVPQGGNTGLVGGGVPLAGEVVLSTRRLADDPIIDLRSGHATVGAGTCLEALQQAAGAAGLAYPVDIASRGTATVGGTIATNAGGLRVLRYGDTRAQLLGVEAVLADGSIVANLKGLARDNSGYHLPSLLAGSEGTLGVVTRATVRLRAPVRSRAVAVIGFPATDQAVAAAAIARGAPAVQAVELMLDPGIQLVARVRGWRPPLSTAAAAYLLVEVGGHAALDDLAEIVEGLPGVVDAALADDPRGQRALWAWRESHTECINTLGPPVKMDVTLPSAALATFLLDVPAIVRRAWAGASTWLFGHVAEGNVHVNATGPPGESGDGVEESVFQHVADVGGSISTEHGIGTAKRQWLHLVRSPSEIAAFRAIKHALDPDHILNPNVLLPQAY